MGRWLGLLLLTIAVLFGGSYASAFLFQLMGPWSAVGIEQDGSTTYMEFGAHLPRPEWLPVYPGATIVQGALLTSATMPSGFHSLGPCHTRLARCHQALLCRPSRSGRLRRRR
jgi:hypothetical protein